MCTFRKIPPSAATFQWDGSCGSQVEAVSSPPRPPDAPTSSFGTRESWEDEEWIWTKLTNLCFFSFSSVSLEVCTNPETAKKKGDVKGEGHTMGPGDAESKQEVLNIVHTIGPTTARLLFL